MLLRFEMPQIDESIYRTIRIKETRYIVLFSPPSEGGCTCTQCTPGYAYVFESKSCSYSCIWKV